MTTDKQAVKAIAEAIIKATRSATEENNKTFVSNQIKNHSGGGGSGSSGGISGSISASQISDLYTTVAGYIINASDNADIGDVIAGRIIQTLNGLASAEIGRATIGYAQIDQLATGIANIIHLATDTAQIQDATIRQLRTDIATVGLANLSSANIGYAQIQDLVAGTSIFREGLGGKLFIDRLSVTDANMVSLTAGELVLKDTNGNLVRIVVDSQTGTVSSQQITLDGDDILNANSLSGTKIIENSITARELNVTSIFADNALIGAIKAANIDTTDLFANSAFLNQIYTNTILSANAGSDIDISGNSSITTLSDRLALVVSNTSSSSQLVLTPLMISAIADQIDLQASTIDLSANTSIDLKVTNAVSSATSSLTSRVSTLESSVSAQSGQIALLATKTEVGLVDDKVTSNTTQIASLTTGYNAIELAVAEIKIDYSQETQPLNPKEGDIWYVPSTDKRYQASISNDVVTWTEVTSTDFSQIVAKINGIDSVVGDLEGNMSLVSQKADKIDWLVASGTSSSNMQLTADAYRVISSNVEITSANQISLNALNNLNLSGNNSVYISSANQISAQALEDINLSANQSITLAVGSAVDSAVGPAVEEAMADATPAVLKIDSSRGTVFKDNQVSTILTVSIHYGSEIISTSQQLHNIFGNGAHLQWEWLRLNDSQYGIILASDSRLSDDGFQFTLGPSDVDVKVTFRCKLITN